MSSEVPADISSYLTLAEQHAKARNWSEAADVCRQATEIASDDLAVLDKLGWYLSRAKRYDEAIQVYGNLVRMEPQKAKWSYMLGYQYYDQGQWKQAIQWFDQALELWDAYIVVLYRKGYAHTQTGESDLAEQAFRRCIAVWRDLEDPSRQAGVKHYSDACYQLGKMLLARGQSRNAERMFWDAVNHGPPDAYKHYNLGKALLKNGKPDEALVQFRSADRIESGKDYILAYMARALMELKQYQEAATVLERIPVRRRKAYVWHDIGKLKLLQEQPQLAIDPLVRAIRLDPRNHNQYHTLGQAYESRGDLVKAYRAYHEAVELRQRHYGLEFPDASVRLAALEQLAASGELVLSEGSEASALPDGHVKTFRANRGYGFISRGNGADLFFHISDVVNPEAIEAGSGVSFEEVDSPKGPRATHVVAI